MPHIFMLVLLSRAASRLILAAGVVAGLLAGTSARAEDAVTEWTVEADRLGGGGANWHTLAIMHMAMHDAAQTVVHRYGRWSPETADRAALNRGADVSAEAAVASAAATVLEKLHPQSRAGIQALLRSALAHVSSGQAKDGGVALGRAIGHAAVEQRRQDGYNRHRPFVARNEPGQWRPALPTFEGSNTTDAMPFLFPARERPGERAPPREGSATFNRDVVEVNLMGREDSAMRQPSQTDAALFWAYQSSQRGFVLMAVRLMDADRVMDLPERARAMSLMTAAMADAAVLTWAEKERWSSWRPITVIGSGAAGFVPNPSWRPLIETPPHPEYPSGHAADCFTGVGMLSLLFHLSGPIDYVAQSALPTADLAAVGMGQHAQPGGLHAMSRRFQSPEAAAQECADSRTWAGAHFRSANEESRRLADAIITKARAALPPTTPPF